MDVGEDSPEARILREHYSQLVNAIQDPESFADGLYSRTLVSRGVVQKVQLGALTKPEKSRILLLAVQDQLIINPCKFDEFIEALSSDSTLVELVAKLQRSHRELFVQLRLLRQSCVCVCVCVCVKG